MSDYFVRSALLQEPGRTAHQWVQRAYDAAFVRSGLLEWIQDALRQAQAGASSPARSLRQVLAPVSTHAEGYLIAAAYTLLVFLVRLLVLCLTLPLFALAAFVEMVDRLVRRDLRRFGAGREWKFLYHRAGASLVPLAVLPWVTYLD